MGVQPISSHLNHTIVYGKKQTLHGPFRPRPALGRGYPGLLEGAVVSASVFMLFMYRPDGQKGTAGFGGPLQHVRVTGVPGSVPQSGNRRKATLSSQPLPQAPCPVHGQRYCIPFFAFDKVFPMDGNPAAKRPCPVRRPAGGCGNQAGLFQRADLTAGASWPRRRRRCGWFPDAR